MHVEVRLVATLRRYLPSGSTGTTASIDVAEGITVSDLTEQLGLPQERDPESGATYLIMVNGEQQNAHVTLHDGDCVSLYPPLAGGVEFARCHSMGVRRRCV